MISWTFLRVKWRLTFNIIYQQNALTAPNTAFLSTLNRISFIPSEVLKDSLVFQSQILHPHISHFEQSVSGVIYRSLSSEQLSQMSGMHLIWFVKITKRNVGEDEAQS